MLARNKNKHRPLWFGISGYGKRSHQSKVIHNPNLLPQPPRLLTNIHHPPDLFLVLLALSENQDQVIFVSPAASKVIGDLSVKLILKPDLQARGSPFLVLLVFRALEVNRTTGLKTCSPRLDISFSQFIRHVSFLFGVFQGKGLYFFSRFRLRSQSI